MKNFIKKYWLFAVAAIAVYYLVVKKNIFSFASTNLTSNQVPTAEEIGVSTAVIAAAAGGDNKTRSQIIETAILNALTRYDVAGFNRAIQQYQSGTMETRINDMILVEKTDAEIITILYNGYVLG